jgi:hydroxyethylthiazole kinase-like uncharacterized protein yjeF
MKRLVSGQEAQLLDQKAQAEGTPSAALMERACMGFLTEIKKLSPTSVLVVCGGGNNGGDGLLLAQMLLESGIKTAVYLASGKPSLNTLALFDSFKGQKIDVFPPQRFDVIVDALFGAGFKGPVRPPYLELIGQINDSGSYVVSLDVPSGLNPSTGFGDPIGVQADLTLAVSFIKQGEVLNDGLDLTGKLSVVDIGIKDPGNLTSGLVEEEDLKGMLPTRKRNVNKGDFGKAAIIGGSIDYIGAPLMALAAEGALRLGAGYAYLGCVKANAAVYGTSFPQAVILPLSGRKHILFRKDEAEKLLRMDAVAMGMGMGVSLDTYRYVEFLLKNFRGNLIIDADGLNSLAKYGTGVLKGHVGPVLLTPHLKEFSRLIGKSVQDLGASGVVEEGKKFAEEYNLNLLLKSASSVLCGEGKQLVLGFGNSGLAKAGSGDLLSGFIVGAAAEQKDLFKAAELGSFVLGRSAELASLDLPLRSITYNDLVAYAPKAIKEIEPKGQ